MKVLRYFVVGGIAASVDIGCFFLLTQILHAEWFWSAVASFVLATTINYLLSIRYVFRSGARFRRHHEVLLVFAVSASGLAINQLVLWTMVTRVGLGLMASKFVATSLLFVWNYGLRKNLVFGERAAG